MAEMDVRIKLSLGMAAKLLPDADALIELVNEGAFDDRLEDILAACHGRKRERRGCRAPYGIVR